MRFNFKFKTRIFSIDVIECKNFLEKGSGLMFRKKSKPLLFIFNKPINEAIHSFFCVPFICIWFNKDKIVETKMISPWKFYIKPKLEFDKFLEIPINSPYYNKIKSLIKN